MGFLSALRIAGSALTAERLRTDVIANNVANMNTTRTAEGGAYKRQQVVFNARQDTGSTFRTILMNHGLGGLAGAGSLPGVFSNHAPGSGVEVQSIQNDNRPAKKVFEPDNPDADVDGFVSYPDIDPVTEMADMLSASRAYEANVTTLNAAKGMAMKALEIGR
jgi:flagellar basal-body rod protein FlgC